MHGLGHIFHWDLDKTYLKSEFDTLGDIVRTARIPAEERENIPGAAALVQAIREDDEAHRVFFLSGSPEQLRGVIEKKFALDGFTADRLVLKPTVSNILRGRFRAVLGQVAYKLLALLHARADAPVGSRETLFGDDSESDAFIYSLYADVVAGAIDRELLPEVLQRAGAYDSQIEAILQAEAQVIREDPVRRIIIHHDAEGRPPVSSGFFPRVVPVYNHLQSAIVLSLDGTMPPRCVQQVAVELLERYGLEEAELLRLSEDVLDRMRTEVAPQAYAQLAEALRLLAPDAAEAFLCALAERVEQQLDAPAPARQQPSRDYIALWEESRLRHEAARKARRDNTGDLNES